MCCLTSHISSLCKAEALVHGKRPLGWLASQALAQGMLA